MSLNLNASPDQLKETIEQQKKKNNRNATIGCYLVLALLVVGLLYGSYKTFQAYREHSRLRNNGVKVEALLNNNYTESRSIFGLEYRVSYSFEVNGQKYNGHGTVTSRPYTRQVKVIYDPADPNNNEPEGAEDIFDFLTSTRCLVGAGILLAISFITGAFKRFSSRRT